MSKIVFILFFVLSMAAGLASARDWSFSRDTVYESGPDSGAGVGTARLLNAGVDTVWIDSVFLDILRPGETQLGVGFVWTPDTVAANVLYSFHLVRNNEPGLGLPPVPPGEFRDLSRFYVQRCGCPAKRAADAPSDSLEGRLRFRSRTGDADSLIVFGSDYVPAGLRGAPASIRSTFRAPVFGLNARDARGRRMGARAPR